MESKRISFSNQKGGSGYIPKKLDAVADEDSSNNNNQQKTIINKLKETLKVQLLKEFYNQGLKENDIINKETWFLKDIIVNSDMIFSTPGGPPSYPKLNSSQQILTPQSANSSFMGDSINIHAQIFYQLQKSQFDLQPQKSLAGNYQQQIGVQVRAYVDELTLILIDNFIFISNYKETYQREKNLRMNIKKVLESLQYEKKKKNNQKGDDSEGNLTDMSDDGGLSESKVGIKFIEANLPLSRFFGAEQGDGARYTLDMRVDQDTPQELIEIGKQSLNEESQFSYLQILMLSDYILFTLREKKVQTAANKGKPNKAVGYARIDLKKMYDNISLSDLSKQKTTNIYSHSPSQTVDYSLSFYPRLEQLNYVENDPQSQRQSIVRSSSRASAVENFPICSVNVKLSLSLDTHTMRQIAQYKDQLAKTREQQAKLRMNKHIQIIEEALGPFTLIKYNEEKGFFVQKVRPDGQFEQHETILNDNMFRSKSLGNRDCGVCESCFIF